MKATYINHMGTDLSVVNAARVSFGKTSSEFSDRDTRLINYLAKHSHWTPFAHTAITVHVKAPLFVARQLGKHQVGMVWNEVSRRYVTDEPEFYEPEVWRKAADNVKQGSSDEPVTEAVGECVEECCPPDGTYRYAINSTVYQLQFEAAELYVDMIRAGVCPEQARMVLPQSMYTEWYWTGNLVSFANMWKLRTDSHTQRETQEVARQIGDIIRPLFPVSWEALTGS